ncbi:hypothetical protein AB395_00006854 (plasmid) [Sinorhizobium fredii CCBAU 45436]|nr:hypothetical protein AB395_00006854 [Sinorhizobium fredii CCBAU 45436]
MHISNHLISELVELSEEPWLEFQVRKFRVHVEIRSGKSASRNCMIIQ